MSKQPHATRQLHDAGQSLWVDNITRAMLDSGTLAGFIAKLSVTGLTSNPTIVDQAQGVFPAGGLADHRDPRLGGEEEDQALADHLVIVHQQDPDRGFIRHRATPAGFGAESGL